MFKAGVLLFVLLISCEHTQASALEPGRQCESPLVALPEGLMPHTVALDLIRRHRAETDPKRRDRIRDRVVLSHLPIFENEFRKYCRKLPAVFSDDCRQEILVGIMRAFDAFDLAKEVVFYTYAQWSVRGAVQAFAETTRANGFMGLKTRLARKKRSELHRIEVLRIAQGESVDDQALADALEISVEELHELKASRTEIISADATYDGTDGGSFYDTHVVEEDESGADETDLDSLRANLKRFRETITKEQDLFVFDHRMLPADGGQPLTFAEIGKRLGITGEWARQIEKRLQSELRRFLNIEFNNQERSLRNNKFLRRFKLQEAHFLAPFDMTSFRAHLTKFRAEIRDPKAAAIFDLRMNPDPEAESPKSLEVAAKLRLSPTTVSVKQSALYSALKWYLVENGIIKTHLPPKKTFVRLPHLASYEADVLEAFRATLENPNLLAVFDARSRPLADGKVEEIKTIGSRLGFTESPIYGFEMKLRKEIAKFANEVRAQPAFLKQQKAILDFRATLQNESLRELFDQRISPRAPGERMSLSELARKRGVSPQAIDQAEKRLRKRFEDALNPGQEPQAQAQSTQRPTDELIAAFRAQIKDERRLAIFDQRINLTVGVRRPTIAELANELGISPDYLWKLEAQLKKEFAAWLPRVSADEAGRRQDLARDFRETVRDPREQKIYDERMGAEKPWTVVRLAKELGISHVTVASLEKEIQRRLEIYVAAEGKRPEGDVAVIEEFKRTLRNERELAVFERSIAVAPWIVPAKMPELAPDFGVSASAMGKVYNDVKQRWNAFLARVGERVEE